MMNDGHLGNILEGRKHKFQKRSQSFRSGGLALVRWTFCQFYVNFKGFMKLKLVGIEIVKMSRFDKNEFDNNMSSLSECWKGGPDTSWSNKRWQNSHLIPLTLNVFQIFLVHTENVSQTSIANEKLVYLHLPVLMFQEPRFWMDLWTVLASLAVQYLALFGHSLSARIFLSCVKMLCADHAHR